ncbi:unnamed protein product [Cochlearia groenlandica]
MSRVAVLRFSASSNSFTEDTTPKILFKTQSVTSVVLTQRDDIVCIGLSRPILLPDIGPATDTTGRYAFQNSFSYFVFT